jgi:hypothetical protein
LLDFQKSRNSTNSEKIFTINLGVCSGELLQFFSPDLLNKKPSIEVCHWRERIGFLLPEHQDKWWTIRTAESLNILFSELEEIIIHIAIPAIKLHLSDEQLSNEWLSGKSPGLTDTQRLVNLSVLLRSIGDIDSLLGVYKELLSSQY